MSDTDETKKITETLYQHNLELAIVNKTLSLLRKLYQISLLTIDPKALSKKISDVVRTDLNLEFVGIFGFDQQTDSLLPFNFSKSDRLLAYMTQTGFLFKDFKIDKIIEKSFLKEVVYGKVSAITSNLEDIWGGVIDAEKLKFITKEAHIKTALSYPLIAEERIIGILLIGLNRQYDSLNEHEKDSIKSCIDVISVALDKAYLYKELQDANENLKNLIKQRESLVHLITHKIKGSFTRSKYLFSEMLAGSFGAITPELTKMTERVLESDIEGIATVDLVLNASNLQKGSVKYDMKPTDFKKILDGVLLEKKGQAENKGLKMNIDIQEDNGEYNISGDAFWLKEVVLNLIQNAIVYTAKGEVNVTLKKIDGVSGMLGKMLFAIKDTGIGITPEDMKNLFTEGGRGKESIKINVDSTGYGLYSVKLIVDAHHGRIWAESEGADKGATFFVELGLIG